MADRLFWVVLSRLWSGWRDILVIVKPETVIGWHRKGFRRFWTRKSRRGKPGRPPVSSEFRGLIRRMSRENPLWGAPRIHGELRMLGFEVSEAAVSKYMPRHPKPPSQTWRTFCQWRSKKGPPRRCKKGPLGGCGLVPVVHGRAPRATRRALNRLTRRRAREGPVGPRGQAWAGWSVQLAVGV